MEFQRLFPSDKMNKRERVEATLRHEPVDRAALHEQLSYNPGVIAMYTGKEIRGFDYTLEDIGTVISKTVDMCFPPTAPVGTDRVTDSDGFVSQRDNWTTWHVSRPFDDVAGARDWLRKVIGRVEEATRAFDAERARTQHREYMLGTQRLIGETVLCAFSPTGFCGVFDRMGLELYTYVTYDYPELIAQYMELSAALEVRRVHAAADLSLSPVILIPEDFSTKQGPIFRPEFLEEYHYPYVRQVADAWKEHGFHVIYHSDGNYKKAIPDLMTCNVDGFYCLEPACGMDIVELKSTWPDMVWAGGVDGVDLMERGTPEEVRAEVYRQVRETDAPATGGMFVASSSEINPPIGPENFRAMIEAVGELRNPAFP
jgi:hypothetical protein